MAVDYPVVPPFQQAINTIIEIHNKKAKDYSEESDPFSNFKTAASMAGVDVAVVFDTLIGIKQARLINLRGEKTPLNESIADTILDRAVYSVLAYAYYLSTQIQPLSDLKGYTLPPGTMISTKETFAKGIGKP